MLRRDEQVAKRNTKYLTITPWGAKIQIKRRMTEYRLATRSLRERTFRQPARRPADELVGAA
jgi:hypothetical protein